MISVNLEQNGVEILLTLAIAPAISVRPLNGNLPSEIELENGSCRGP